MDASKFRFLVRFFLALLVALTVSTFPACKKKAEAPPPPPPTPTPVIPPGSVVFIQRGHLVRLDMESNQVTPLTGGKSTEWFPSCSPKGDQVVYWSNSADGVYNLWKINLDGSSRAQLTFDDTDSLDTNDQNLLVNTAPSWSPDGKRILYASRGDIWVMDADGFNPESVLMGRHALCPLFAPDVKTVLFVSNQDDPVYNLYSLNLADKTVKKVTNYTDWNVGSPSFSLDGKKVLYNLYRSNVTQVYTANAQDGTEPLNITNNNRSLCPKYALNGRKIIYCAYGSGDDVTLNLYQMNANGTEVKSLTSEGGSSPSWAPARILTALPSPVASPVATPAAALPTPVGK